MLEADDRRAAVCATRPSDNVSRLVESYEFVKAGFENNTRNSYEKFYGIVIRILWTQIFTKIHKKFCKLGPRSVLRISAVHIVVIPRAQ